MASDHSKDHRALPDLVIAPLTDRPLDELPPAINEALQDFPDLRRRVIALRERFLRLQEQGRTSLRPHLDDIVIGCPDLEWLPEWFESLSRGEVPPDLSHLTHLQAMGEYLEHHFYSEVLGPIRANVDSALSKGLSAAGLLVSRADLTHLSKMREDGEVAEADAYQALLIDRTFEAAERLSSAFAHWLRAFEHVLPILSGMRPADLVRGGVTRAHPGKAGATKKYARGIQAATAKVYRAGMSEQDCWEALGGVEDETFPVEGAVYEFRLDRRETEIVTAWQTDDRTGRERSIKRTSFHPYFVRAREALPTTR